jgi:hypothetical protein
MNRLRLTTESVATPLTMMQTPPNRSITVRTRSIP